MPESETVTLRIPRLTEEQWRMILNTFASKTDIPTDELWIGSQPETDSTCPSRTKIASNIAADLCLDELPADDPRVTETLQPFLALTEAQAMTALLVNNLLWETGEALWQPASDAAA